MLTNMNAKKQLLYLLKNSVSDAEHTLSSGKTSSWYINCRKPLLTTGGMYSLGYTLRGIIPKEITSVGGLTMGSDPISYAYCAHSIENIYAFSIRKESKAHGLKDRAIGTMTDEMVLVDDVSTTGKSFEEAVEVVRVLGYEPSLLITLIDRNGKSYD